MSTSTISDTSPVDGRLRDVLGRSALRLAGLLVLLLTAALVASLATWNVDDPSFTHAADTPVANLLGVPGAVAADLGMQFLGLGVLGLVFPLIVVGWRLSRPEPAAAAVPAAACLGRRNAAALGRLSCLPVVAQWPLPTGLGGAAGDLVISAAEWLVGGSPSAGLYAAMTVVFGGLSLGLLWASCMGGQARPVARAQRRTAAAKAPRRMSSRDDEESPSRGLAQLAAGALAHMSLAARAAVRRRLAHPPQAARPASRDSGRRELARREPAPAPLASPAPVVPRAPLQLATRREPQFGGAPASRAPEPAVFEADTFEDEDEGLDAVPAPLPSVRAPQPVAAPAPERIAPLRQPPTLRIPDSWKFGRKSAAKAEEPHFEPVAEAEIDEDECEADFKAPAAPSLIQPPVRPIVQAASAKPKAAPRVLGQAPRQAAAAVDTFELPRWSC
jgi:S-DNA-T family DNA segregation ATPase FtsK/SpoIIIE